jgi:putative nucleotidyltransferase with HDIG domain
MLLRRQRIIDYAKSLASLPTLNTLTRRLSRLLAEPDVSFRALSEEITYDPGLSTRLISAANSAWYNRGVAVVDVTRAMTMLGIEEVTSLVVCGLFYDGILKKAGMMRKPASEFWRHSLLVAFATKNLSIETSPVSEEAFTAGLLHDIGKVPFFLNPDLQSTKVATWHLSWEKEQETLGTDHCEVGFYMAREWKLPEMLQDVIRLHHQDKLDASLAKSVRDADILMNSPTEDNDLKAIQDAARGAALRIMDVFSS